MRLFKLLKIVLLKVFFSSSLFCAILPHQGRVLKDGQPFDGLGYFKFALVRETGEEANIVWSHEGTDRFPENPLHIFVNKGFYQCRLGDVSIPGMEPLPNELFVYEDPLSLRIWFNEGNSSNEEQLGPDQPLQIAPYAISTPLTETDKVTELLTKELETVAADKDTTTDSLIERVATLAGGIPASETTFNGLEDYLKPILVKDVNKTITTEKVLILSADIDGRMLEFEWEFTPEGENTGNTMPSNTNKLIIEDFDPLINNGDYRITASNHFGTVTSSISINE